MDMLEMMAHGSKSAKKNYEKIVAEEEEMGEMTEEEVEEYHSKNKRKEILKKKHMLNPQVNSTAGNFNEMFGWVYK